MINIFTEKNFKRIKKENEELNIENQKLIQIIQERNLIIINLEKMIIDFVGPF